MAALIDEKYLLEQTDDNKKEIINRIKEKIADNKKKYPDWKKRPHLLREGLPKPFLFGDEIVQIKNVRKFAEGLKNIQLTRQSDAKKIREALLRAMTDKTGAARKTAYGRGARKLFRNQEDHHIIFRTLLDKFYKNLPEDQAAELTAHLARRGSPVGNVIENLQGVDIDLHDSKDPNSIHQWARNMGIESKSFPDLTNLDFDARTAAIDEWLNLIEQPLLEKTAEVLAQQDLRRYPKGLPKSKLRDRPNLMTKEGWLEFLTTQRENVKARANLLDKYPILDIDLDSPDIRPELKARYEKALSLVPEEVKQQWAALSPSDAKQAGALLSANEFKGSTDDVVTEVGRRLGGIDSRITAPKTSYNQFSHLLRDGAALGNRFLRTPVGKVVGATTTGFLKLGGKAVAGIDPLNTVLGTHKALTASNLADKILGAKDALGTGAWFAPKLLSVLAPISTGSIIGGTQAGGAERVRKVTDDENFITGFGTSGTIINQQNPFEGLFKKKNDDDELND